MSVILVVDDEESILEVISEVLEDKNYQVVYKTDAKGIETDIEKIQPKCILMDVMLPHENGDSITRRLKMDVKYKDIPVILMSAGGDLEKKAKYANANKYLTKPFDNDQLVSVVDSYCMDL